MSKPYVLHYREPGKRPGKSRNARRPVQSVQEAVDWINANPDAVVGCVPYVETNVYRRWGPPSTVAILTNPKPNGPW